MCPLNVICKLHWERVTSRIKSLCLQVMALLPLQNGHWLPAGCQNIPSLPAKPAESSPKTLVNAPLNWQFFDTIPHLPMEGTMAEEGKLWQLDSTTQTCG